jgi:hypothetical protein
MMMSVYPTRDEVAAARRASYESVKAIINGRHDIDDNIGDDTDASEDDVELSREERARLEAILHRREPSTSKSDS